MCFFLRIFHSRPPHLPSTKRMLLGNTGVDESLFPCTPRWTSRTLQYPGVDRGSMNLSGSVTKIPFNKFPWGYLQTQPIAKISPVPMLRKKQFRVFSSGESECRLVRHHRVVSQIMRRIRRLWRHRSHCALALIGLKSADSVGSSFLIGEFPIALTFGGCLFCSQLRNWPGQGKEWRLRILEMSRIRSSVPYVACIQHCTIHLTFLRKFQT